MLNNEVKALINEVIELYSTSSLTQGIINLGTEKIKEAIELLKNNNDDENEEEGVEKNTPITLEELESLFPSEPEYPSLQLQEADMEVNLKSNLLSLDVEEGTKVKTKGYYSVNDGGQAVYEIMSYDNWWNELPIELKMIHVASNGLGNSILYKNPVDNFGHHKLNNGMVAKLLPNLDGYVRVEQWGVFEGRKDNNRALMAVCAYNHQNAKILFGKNKKYILNYTPETPHWKNASGISTTGIPRGVSEDNFGSIGNEYALLLHSRSTTKPVIGDAKNLELCGNNCEFYIPDEQFTIGGADFALIECGGRIDGLKIHGFHLNGNHMGQLWQGKEAAGAPGARKCNHGISYFTSGINIGNQQTNNLKDGNGLDTGLLVSDVRNYNGDFQITTFNNVEIYGNHFESLGTAGSADDCGGDAVLIINPIQSDNVSIHNNRVTNWGRWCFSIDLGGSGERFHNYTIKQNICIQDENNTFAIPFTNPRKRATSYRGLGFIDFEARKCFTNLDVSENYVYGMNCWAFNGNGKISENIKIERNNITRAPWKYKSGYPYQCSFYSVGAKNMSIRNNKFGAGSLEFARFVTQDTFIENNTFEHAIQRIHNPLGEVTYKNNVVVSEKGSSRIILGDELQHIDDVNSEFYIPKEQQYANITIENNTNGGFVCDKIVEDGSYHKNTTIIAKNNDLYQLNLAIEGIKELILENNTTKI